MVDQHLLTIFLAVITVAILIQTGIVAGLFFVSMRLTRQADRAATEVRRFQQPVHNMVESLETMSNHLMEFGVSAKSGLRQFELQLDRTLDRIRRKAA